MGGSGVSVRQGGVSPRPVATKLWGPWAGWRREGLERRGWGARGCGSSR